MSLSNLFTEAKQIKDIIRYKTGMIDLIERDIQALIARKKDEYEAVEKARATLEEIKSQLNSKIVNEEWDDIFRAQKYTVAAVKKGVTTSVKTMQSFLKKMKIIS